ncbi:methyltransferase [Brevibacillus ruminantium]|uniref:Methyltransferase n=1 Tax=Brevibacillus ruminantium TaxID=2950604 RepID=A0ABY4WLS6_9BACL|nr:methyltransferase [Brevibacillus ruminantium]USG67088.1 methyltransferase [Brevibacillus ruminantium]
MKSTSERTGCLEPKLIPITDKLLFASRFLISPRSVGSIIPSSRQLVKKMIEPVNWERATSIVELGAGTGVFTEAIRSAMRRDCTALILEQDEKMRQRLIRRFPDLSYGHDARRLIDTLKENGAGQVDAIISGLPFANFPQEMRDDILDQVEAALKPNGVFVQFQYSLQMNKQLRKRFGEVAVHFVPFNVPSAFVYVCRKRR